MTWKDAIVRVLTEEGAALHYADISDRILDQGLRTTIGATPAATVNVTLTESMHKEGAQSPFVRVERGVYMLKALAATSSQVTGSATSSNATPDTSDVDEAKLVHAFGMYWERAFVQWVGSPQLLGRQQVKAKTVDFSTQRGVYLLYDGREVVYVGRVTERALGVRLYEHTQDPLRSRWNRFSWFGLLSVTQDGQLREVPYVTTTELLAATLEALLVEGLEPPQNRRRGDGFTAVEYLQVEDPAIEQQRFKDMLAIMQSKLSAH